MNKAALLMQFPIVAPSAIKKIDDEWRLVGKYCQVTCIDQKVWDFWICNSSNLPKGLGARKLNAILEKLREETALTELDGEAYAEIQGKDLIVKNLDLIGIKRRRKLTEVQLEERRKLIAKINARRKKGQCVKVCKAKVGRMHI